MSINVPPVDKGFSENILSQTEVLKPHWRSLPRGLAVPLVGDEGNRQKFRVGHRGGRLELWVEPSDDGLPQVHARTWNHVLGGEENNFILPPNRDFIGRGDWSFCDGHDHTIGRCQFAVFKDKEGRNFFLSRMSIGYVAELTNIAEKITPPVHAFGATSRGRRRNNEDSFLCVPPRGLYLVCDGVGGRKGGEIASRIAVDVVSRLLKRKNNIPLAVSDANAEIVTNGQGAAATIVGAVETSPNHFNIFNLGDSRAYLINRQTGQITMLTHDHVEIQNGKKIVTGALGHDVSDLNRTEVSLRENEFLLLCTDGFSDYLDSGDITPDQVKSVLVSQPLNITAKSLVALANRAGGKDNITAVIIGRHQ